MPTLRFVQLNREPARLALGLRNMRAGRRASRTIHRLERSHASQDRKGQMSTPQITTAKVADLLPYANNAREHTDEQVAQVAASIQEFGWTNPIITHGQTVVAGHARLAAARKLNLEEVPIIDRSDMSETQWKAYVLADNRLSELSSWDQGLLELELQNLDELNFDLDLTGFSFTDLDALDDEDLGDELDKYTRKIETPIYEITGDKPDISDLFDYTKTAELLAEIDAAGLPNDVADFLKIAATRHTIFDFSNIAEFYAHSNSNIQELMERSALVIVDFEKAIEEGFVKTTERLGEIANLDRDDEGSPDYA